MRDERANANHPARNGQTSITATTESSLKALQPIALLQVSILRMWAHSIEWFAGNYEKALDKPVAKPANARLCETRPAPRAPAPGRRSRSPWKPALGEPI
jgi:hypothetical protein